MPSPIIMTIASVFKSAGLNQARQALTGASKDFQSLAGTIGQAAGAFGAFQALASSREFILNSVDIAQRFERNILALKQVFEEATPALRIFIKEVENYGLSQSQAAQASVFLGSVLKQYGFSVNESSQQTQRLVTLAQDLATTYGYDVQEALLAITALFRGEYDPIEKFGVAMKQNEINSYLAAQGLDDLEGQQRLNAEATTRLTLLFERAGDSVGAFARASDTLYGAQQRLNAVTQNLQVAFGENLQGPLAAVVNALSDLAADFGPEAVEISDQLGIAIEKSTPIVIAFAESLLEVTRLLQPIIELTGSLVNGLSVLLVPTLDLVNGLLRSTGDAFDLFSAAMAASNQELGEYIMRSGGVVDSLIKLGNFLGLDDTIAAFNGELSTGEGLFKQWEYYFKAITGDFSSFDNGAKRASLAMRASGLAAREAAQNTEEAAVAVSYFEGELQALGFTTRSAEGDLVGLARIFAEIDQEARKSQAAEALDEIGFSASQIEKLLTEPDWEQIFGEIRRLAKLTAIDMAKINPFGTEYFEIEQAKRTLGEIMNGLGKGEGEGQGSPAKNFVKEFLDGIAEEVKKQTARGNLERLGIASEGLLNEIFGSEGWEDIYKRILQGGTEYLANLQNQFEKTADGLKEITSLMEEERKKQEADAAAALRALEEQRAKLEEYNQEVERRIALALEFRDAIRQTSLMDVLDDQERKIGRFESSVAGFFDGILSSLERAFDNEVILEDAYRELVNYANAEKAVLTSIQRQRDEVAERINLAEALINEYKSAFTGAVNLANILSQVEKKTNKVTVTEMTEGMVTLNSSLKEFKVTLTRSFEQAQEETVDKTQALITNFRNIAEKARTFAQNLRTLRDMGLDPMLFNQLVEAGVEAGGETAQALVDGGSETVKEVSDIFREIDTLGGNLGEEVARTLYGAGVQMGTGLLEGLKAQAQALKDTATALATGFADAFTAKIDAAVKEALDKLASINAPGTPSTTFGQDALGMPTVTINPGLPGYEAPVELPQVILPTPLPTMPLLPGPGLGMPTVIIQTDSRYGGYQAAQAFTAQQSRLATNNAGISSFIKI